MCVCVLKAVTQLKRPYMGQDPGEKVETLVCFPRVCVTRFTGAGDSGQLWRCPPALPPRGGQGRTRGGWRAAPKAFSHLEKPIWQIQGE